MPSVLQPWLEEIPIRMQSTLLLSLRGPDTHRCPNIKAVQRWMRGLTFRPGNPKNVHEFMAKDSEVPHLEEKNDLARELEFTTPHFYSHLMHGLEVLAYRHPLPSVRFIAYKLFINMCGLFHLDPEIEPVFEARLEQINWCKEIPQPDDLEQAQQAIHMSKHSVGN